MYEIHFQVGKIIKAIALILVLIPERKRLCPDKIGDIKAATEENSE